MNAKERFEARLAGKPVDRIPNLSIVMLFAAQHAGIPYGQFVTDYRALAEAQLKAAEDFGLDILSTMSDPFRETADFGAKLIYPDDDLPICSAPRIRDISEFSTLSLWDPYDSVRMLDRIRAVEVFSRSKKQEYPILGWVEAPLAELCDLMTMQEGLAALVEEPEAAEEALDLLAEQAIRCALAQIEAGADVIGMGDAAASLVSTDMYRELIVPAERKVIEAIQKHGAACKLHICGNTTHILDQMIDTGAKIVDIDYMVDYGSAVVLSAGRTSICGNIDPVSVFLSGTEEKLIAEVQKCMDAMDEKALISSGCEVPRYTRPEQMKALARFLKNGL
ncbi:MAG: uroporphyrinogen decarboxylase family protein [Clostridia bacterium]|nr:uroporphyrinogen decarboxylase family protein [Clostridia bacterium]